MIPYDDLVAALSAWRARKGLPVSTIGAPTAPPPAAPIVAKPAPGSGPRPAPPQPRVAATPVPLPLAPPEDSLDVDDSAMLEEVSAYENEGADFALAFNAPDVDDDGAEATSIGSAPERPSGDPTRPGPPPRPNNRNDDW